jgi:hypothetical protein
VESCAISRLSAYTDMRHLGRSWWGVLGQYGISGTSEFQGDPIEEYTQFTPVGLVEEVRALHDEEFVSAMESSLSDLYEIVP